MLQRKMPETDPRRAILEKIEKQTFRASRIVNSLLNFSRQETGEFRRVDLNAVVDETLALAEIQLRKKQIVVETTLDDDVPVHGDPIKLQQVLMNLLLNARDAMPQGGSVSISTIRQNGSAILQVRDNGAGIDAETIDKVYDPFFTTKGIGKGTGLGLSVSYGIIQEHHGSITVDSTPGEGTVFRISLPAAADTQAAAG
jgi:signal transduction histidine kinase